MWTGLLVTDALVFLKNTHSFHQRTQNYDLRKKEGGKEWKEKEREAKHCVYGMHRVPISSTLGHSLLEGGRRTLRLQSKWTYWLIEFLRVRLTGPLPKVMSAVTTAGDRRLSHAQCSQKVIQAALGILLWGGIAMVTWAFWWCNCLWVTTLL